MNRLKAIAGALALVLLSSAVEAAPPRVVTSTVEDGQDDVDPALTEIRVQFDQTMNPNSWSFVGGGPKFPQVVGKPQWADPKTIVIMVKLEPDHEYWMSINNDTFQGFRSRAGEPAIPQPLGFRTRAAGPAPKPADLLTPEGNRAAVAALRKAIDGDYAYRDRLNLDWEKIFAEHAPAMEAATTPNQFARAAARVLRQTQDGHVYLRAGERTIWTNVNARPPNFNIQTLRTLVPQWKQYDGGVATGKLPDNVDYLMIAEWTPAVSKALGDAFADVKDGKGLIIDVRPNGGGDENLAKEFAGRFIDGPKVYSKDRIRRGGQWLGPYDRVVEPRAGAEPYKGPVAVLIGPKVGSSCESFVLMMKQAPRCKLVGEQTKGSSGNPKPHELGNGVTVFLSSWEDQMPDGTVVEGRGITPDVTVKATLTQLRQGDPVLEAAKELARE
jgi:Peptidase family S41